MPWITYNNINSFHWNSNLSDEYKQEIIKFLHSLKDEEVAMIEELIKDARDWGFEDGYDDAGGE